jgi:hypothetical protein
LFFKAWTVALVGSANVVRTKNWQKNVVFTVYSESGDGLMERERESMERVAVDEVTVWRGTGQGKVKSKVD